MVVITRVVDAPLRLRLGDHVEHVDADRELRRHHGRVDVVARVGAQLRHAAVEVADLHLPALPGAEDAQHHGQRHDDDRRAPASSTPREPPPERLHVARRGGAGARGSRASNWTYDSATGSSTRFVRMMAATPMLAAIAISWMTRIWMNRIVTNPMTSVASATPAGQEQPAEAVAGRRHRVGAVEDLRPERADHLHAVAHARWRRPGTAPGSTSGRCRSRAGDHAELPDDRQHRARRARGTTAGATARRGRRAAPVRKKLTEEEQHDALARRRPCRPSPWRSR